MPEHAFSLSVLVQVLDNETCLGLNSVRGSST